MLLTPCTRIIFDDYINCDFIFILCLLRDLEQLLRQSQSSFKIVEIGKGDGQQNGECFACTPQMFFFCNCLFFLKPDIFSWTIFYSPLRVFKGSGHCDC